MAAEKVGLNSLAAGLKEKAFAFGLSFDEVGFGGCPLLAGLALPAITGSGLRQALESEGTSHGHTGEGTPPTAPCKLDRQLRIADQRKVYLLGPPVSRRESRICMPVSVLRCPLLDGSAVQQVRHAGSTQENRIR